LQLGLTRPEDQQSVRLPQVTDDLVVVMVKMLAVAFPSYRFSPPSSWGPPSVIVDPARAE
jgi:hypothetical protein